MSVFFTTCALCGAPVEDISHSSEVDSTTWLNEFRVVYTILDQWKAARLSRIGERRQYEDVIPLDESVDVTLPGIEEGASEIEIYLMRTHFGDKFPPPPPLTPQPAWGYPFHNCCWEILSAASIHFTGSLNVQAIFDLCRSQPYCLGHMNWGHDYDGSAAYYEDVGKLFPGEEPSFQQRKFKGYNHLYNPLDFPELRRLFTATYKHHGTEQANLESLRKQRHSYRKDPFGKFPVEILQMIFICANSRDVCNLRLASPVCSLTALTDSFWHSRFWQGREFDYVFEAISSYPAGGNWKWLFQRTSALARDPKMANRKRVWNLARRLCELVSLRLSFSSCGGIPIRTLFEPMGLVDKKSWLTAGPVLRAPESDFSEGARSLYERRVTFQDACKIFISVISINQKQYISGLRLVQEDGEDVSLGYCLPDKECVVALKSSHRSAATIRFQVAFDYKGVRGLRILWPGEVHSNWIGDWYNLSHKLLIPPMRVLPLNLKGGFDALKMVSLFVTDEGETSSAQQSSLNQVSNLRESATWSGGIPPKELSYLRPIHPSIYHRGNKLPFSLNLFGGINASQLPYLTEIAVWVVNDNSASTYADRTYIWAMEFFYSQPINGKHSTLLGQIPDSQDFDVYRINLESHKDERIIGLEPFFKGSSSLCGFIVHTNRDRSVEIPPSCSALVDEIRHYTDLLKPEGTIVGLYAVLKHGPGALFRSLGVAYIPSTLPPPLEDGEKEDGS